MPKYTIVLMEGNAPKRAIGIFDTREQAIAWAKADGWEPELFRVVELWP